MSSKGKARDEKKEEERPWSAGMDERRSSVRVAKVEKNLEDLTGMVAELLARNPAKAADGAKPGAPIIFESEEGRASYEEEADAGSTARRSAYASRKALKDLWDVTTASYEAEGDVFSDLNLLHASFVQRRSRWAAVEKKINQGAGNGAKLLKALPWITVLVVGSLLVYGIVDQPPTFQFVWDRIASDVRLQIVLGFTLAVVLGAVLWWLWRSRRKPKEA